MLACIDEVQTSAWREGMIVGLTECLNLCTQKGLQRHHLHHAIEDLNAQETPAPYRRYLRTYSRQPLVSGIVFKAVSHWQWRTCAIELFELITAAEMLGCPGGRREEELRSVLLLADDEPSTAPYAALVAGGVPTDPQPLFEDGFCDALLRSAETLASCKYEAAAFKKSILRDLNNLWPRDYVTYRTRAVRGAAAGEERILPFTDWCAAVHILDDAQSSDSSEHLPLAILHKVASLLLLGPNDRIPTFAWSLSQELAEDLAQ